MIEEEKLKGGVLLPAFGGAEIFDKNKILKDLMSDVLKTSPRIPLSMKWRGETKGER